MEIINEEVMQYDTAGNIILEPATQCNCGSTADCEKCQPQQLIPIIKFFDICPVCGGKRQRRRVDGANDICWRCHGTGIAFKILKLI